MDLRPANIKPTATSLPDIFYARARCHTDPLDSSQTVVNVTLPQSGQGLRLSFNTQDHAPLFRHLGESGHAMATFKRMPGNPTLYLSALEPMAS